MKQNRDKGDIPSLSVPVLFIIFRYILYIDYIFFDLILINVKELHYNNHMCSKYYQ